MFSHDIVKSVVIIISSAAAFIAISKSVSILRKKFGGNAKVKPIFDCAKNTDNGFKHINETQHNETQDKHRVVLY